MSNLESNLVIRTTGSSDGASTRFGPIDPGSGAQLSIPKHFEREVLHTDDEMTLRVSCEFTGDWVRVEKLCVAASPNVELTSRYLVKLALPAIVHSVSLNAIPNAGNWLRWNADDEVTGDRKSNDAFLAQLYWLEHISQGNPRQTLMRYLAMPRSTCNVLIRRLRSNFALPTPRTELKIKPVAA